MGFKSALDATLIFEGVYSSRIDDGETVFGISRYYWPGWKGWAIVDKIVRRGKSATIKEDLKAEYDKVGELHSLVHDFYLDNFWNRKNLSEVDKISHLIAEYVFDYGVNQGSGRSALALQEGINFLNRNQLIFKDLVVDGKVGPRTIEALKMIDRYNNIQQLHTVLRVIRGNQYLEIFRKKPWQEVYVGWIDRI
jgi:lysozyme family protein